MKNLKILMLCAGLISSKTLACTHNEASNVANSSIMQIARGYNASKVGITGLSSLNGIATVQFIIFQPIIDGVQGASDLIGNIVIDLNTCNQIDGSAATFNILNVN